MERKWRLLKNVVLYIEENESQKFGTFHNFFTDDKMYINNDMTAIVLHVLNGDTIESFFPKKIIQDLGNGLIEQSLKLLKELANHGFLTNDTALSGGIVKSISTNPALRVVFIETTKDCNLRCEHCYVPDCQKPGKDKQLNSLELRNLINQADEIGVMEIQLTGGEFFILPEALDIIKNLQKRLLPCSIFTNGTLFTPVLFEYLSEMHHGLIFYISLDGPMEIHDKFRGVSGCFEKTIKNIHKLLEIGCDVRINTTVGIHNIDYLKNFINYIKEEFGILHRLVEIESIGRAKDQDTLMIADQKIVGLSTNFQFLDSHDRISTNDWKSPACGIGCAMMFIDAYGNISLCPILTQEQDRKFLAGNIRESSLKEIWETSPVFNRFRDIQCSEIETCEFRELCKGGCRSKAYLATNDINAPDKSMCCLYNNTKK